MRPIRRNGEWEYQAFLGDGKVDAKAHPDSCFQCHKNSTNFMFTATQLDGAEKWAHSGSIPAGLGEKRISALIPLDSFLSQNWWILNWDRSVMAI